MTMIQLDPKRPGGRMRFSLKKIKSAILNHRVEAKMTNYNVALIVCIMTLILTPMPCIELFIDRGNPHTLLQASFPLILMRKCFNTHILLYIHIFCPVLLMEN